MLRPSVHTLSLTDIIVSVTGISVVIPLYNNECEVTRAVRSVLAQTCEPEEILIVDDGSTDNSAGIAAQIQDARIRLIRQPNAGVSSARNTGVNNATYGIIAFLDADDEWKPEFLETIQTLVDSHPACSVFGTSYVYCEKSGLVRSPILRKVIAGDWAGELTGYFRIASSSDPPLWSSAVAVRKEALLSIGGFPVGIRSGEDLLTWARLASRYRIAYSTRPCSVFHLRGEIAGVPTRVPETPDHVGNALHALANTVDMQMRRDVRRYVAFWHRMRLAMFVQLNQRSRALHELWWIAKYHWTSPQLYLYLGLLLLPSAVRQRVLMLLSSIKIHRRRPRAHG